MSQTTPIPSHLPSLCIPRMSLHITKDKVIDVLETMQLGLVQRVQFIYYKDNHGETFAKVFVHFSSWTDECVRNRLLQGKPVHVVYHYDEPWFWKLCLNRKDHALSSC
jgi:hypothetical protein